MNHCSKGPATDNFDMLSAIVDWVETKVTVIGLVPNDEKALEPALEKARAAGIKVIAHEGPGIKNKDRGFELASAKGFGEAHAELLAQAMGGKGEYAVFVGSLTAPLHNASADAAIAYLKVKYPDMKPVGDRYGVAENVDDSRKTALDLITATADWRVWNECQGKRAFIPTKRCR